MAPKKPIIPPREIFAFIYARRSSDRQNEESTAQQVAVCKEMAERMGFTVIRVFADEAITGKTDRRPEFQKMVRAIESGKSQVQIVMAYKSNRIARNMLQALTYENRFEQAGVKIIYAKEEFGDNAAGRFALRNMMNLNQFYSENMSEDIKRSLYTYAQDCKVLNGNLPLGYQKGEDGKYAVDYETAPIVQEIFFLYASGVKSSEICRIMNGRGIRTSRGKKFSVGTIERIVKNDKYIGIYRYGDICIENGVPPIIDKDTFEECSRRLSVARKAPAASWHQTDYLLTGKLFCGHCEAPMRGESGRGRHGNVYNYYCCARKKKDTRLCDKKRVSKDMIEDAVIDFTVKHALTDEVINAVADAVIEIQNKQKHYTVHQQRLDRIAEISRRLNSLVKVIGDGFYTKALGQEMVDLEKEQEALSAKVAEESYEQPIFTKEQVVEWMTSFRDKDPSAPKTRRQIIDIFVNAIYLYDDHFIITYNTSRQQDTIPLSTIEAVENAENGSPLSTFEPPNDYIANPSLVVIGDIVIMRVPIVAV